MQVKGKILVAPLNWGLGHATRCIPIIEALINNGFEPVIASDGLALALLQKEFPSLIHEELPSYKITYAQKGKHFKLKMVWDSPKILAAIQKEKKCVKMLVRKHQILGIISDNRLGVRYKKIPCVFITHQLNVLSGNTTWFSSKIHRSIIKKYDQCWVPDVEGKPNLTGKLGHLKKSNLNLKYLGVLSRFKPEKEEMVYELMVLLSGPEPQRTLLENQLLKELKNYRGRVRFVCGLVSDIQKEQKIVYQYCTIEKVNFLQTKELQSALNQSKLVLSRSGYTTVMDLAQLNKKAFFIPTPGQYEQVYLAKRLEKQTIAPTSSQEEFTIDHLKRVEAYKGLSQFANNGNWSQLFLLFEDLKSEIKVLPLADSRVKENSEPTCSSLST